jgi:hypothetical protein
LGSEGDVVVVSFWSFMVVVVLVDIGLSAVFMGKNWRVCEK